MTELKVLKHEVHETHFSVQIHDSNAGLTFWMDVNIDTEFQDVSADWNGYIFQNDDPMIEYQLDGDNFEDASDLAIQHIVEQNLIYQDNKAKWHKGPGLEIVFDEDRNAFYIYNHSNDTTVLDSMNHTHYFSDEERAEDFALTRLRSEK